MPAGDVSRYDEGLPERLRPAMERVFQVHSSVFVVVNVFLIAIWAAAGMGYFWPIWPILGWGLAVGLHAMATYSFRR